MTNLSRISFQTLVAFGLMACTNGNASNPSTVTNSEDFVGYWNVQMGRPSTISATTEAGYDFENFYPAADSFGYGFVEITQSLELVSESRGTGYGYGDKTWLESKVLSRVPMGQLDLVSQTHTRFVYVDPDSGSQIRCDLNLKSANRFEMACAGHPTLPAQTYVLERLSKTEVNRLRAYAEQQIRFIDGQRPLLKSHFSNRVWKMKTYTLQNLNAGFLESFQRVQTAEQLPEFISTSDGVQLPYPKRIQFSESLDKIQVNGNRSADVNLEPIRDQSSLRIRLTMPTVPQRYVSILSGKIELEKNGFRIIQHYKINNEEYRTAYEFEAE